MNMRTWIERPNEIKYLLNPAFCGCVIIQAISDYQRVSKRSFPFPLVYLTLPLVLHENTRISISSRTKMELANWVQKNPELFVSFPKRARDYVTITNEAVEWLMLTGFLKLTESGELEKVIGTKSLGAGRSTYPETKECLQKAGQIGRWFANAGKVETIYIILGVRP